MTHPSVGDSLAGVSNTCPHIASHIRCSMDVLADLLNQSAGWKIKRIYNSTWHMVIV